MELLTVEPEKNRAILYLSEEEDRPELLFFAEDLIKDSSSEPVHKHFWIRLKERYEHIAVENFAVDRFVRRLRSFKKIKVLLGQPIEAGEVKERLKRILRERSYHHFRWMIVDLLLLPVSLFVAVLPGPNLWGYYLLFRVYSHWKAYRAAVRANLENVDVEVSPQAFELSRLVKTKKDIRSALKEIRKNYGLRALQEHHFFPEFASLKETWKKLISRGSNH